MEQKQSVIDEKEIEILEKVGIIEQLQEKLAAVQQTQEIKNVELQANVEEKSRKIAELEEVGLAFYPFFVKVNKKVG